MELPRIDPDRLLKAIARNSSVSSRGRLKIFFGYAAGVGKTYSMLKAAHQAKKNGIDVVAGYIEPHARPKTAALLGGLEILPAREALQSGIRVKEFDVDAAIRRKPQLILVDELAHTNADGSRHAKRYQDIKELLNAGIDVYTTVNVQHIESLNDTVAAITGIIVRERIPDSVFDEADQVEIVDIEPLDLLARLSAGEVYSRKQAQRAAENFFTLENLTALREIALRRCADRVNRLTEDARIQGHGNYHTDEHILVCLSPSPSNPGIVRTASKMAKAFKGAFTALLVETPDASDMSDEDKKRLRENIRIAQQLGADIETVYGSDVAYQISEFARLAGVSKIVIGRSDSTRKNKLSKRTITERLLTNVPDLDVHIVPDNTSNYRISRKKRGIPSRTYAEDVLKCFLMLALATASGLIFRHFGFTEANIIAAYILCVLVVSIVTSSRLCSLLCSFVSVVLFNFCFTSPILTLKFDDPGYIVTFIVMFTVAFIAGTITSKLTENARQLAQSTFRTRILLETNRLLQTEQEEEGVVRVVADQLSRLLEKDLVIYLSPDGTHLNTPYIQRTPCCSSVVDFTTDNEKAVAYWVLKNNKRAGATTDTLSSAKCLYMAIRVNHTVYGVVGIAVEGNSPDAFENNILISILGEGALALENIRNLKEKEEAAVLAENEQLRANLLRAISHDLRTPLTSISGNACNLMSNCNLMDDETKQQIFTDIYDDSMWLINLVENLLAVTRIDEDRVTLRKSVELMDEVVTEALRHVRRHGKNHEITVTSTDDLILAQIEAKLIVQVIVNLVDNAIKYTPDGSKIKIHTETEEDMVKVSVSDNGPGIDDSEKKKVFEMFYSGAKKVTDSYRSIGLGLTLCKLIVEAHGGKITLSDNIPHGAVFTFTVPKGEVQLNE